MQQSYQIISQNDLERQGDVRNAFITVCSSDSPFISRTFSFAEMNVVFLDKG